MKVKSGSNKVTIKIPRVLYNKISRVIEGGGYDSVTGFVVYVLRDLVASHELAGRDSGEAENLERVKEHLTALGYLGNNRDNR